MSKTFSLREERLREAVSAVLESEFPEHETKSEVVDAVVEAVLDQALRLGTLWDAK